MLHISKFFSNHQVFIKSKTNVRLKYKRFENQMEQISMQQNPQIISCIEFVKIRILLLTKKSKTILYSEIIRKNDYTRMTWRVWWCIRGNGLCKPDNRISTIVFHTKGGTAEAEGAGGGWQSSDKTEKQQHSEAYSFHADNPSESRLTPEPPALSVAGPFSSLPIRKNFSNDIRRRSTIPPLLFCLRHASLFCTLFFFFLHFSFNLCF